MSTELYKVRGQAPTEVIKSRWQRWPFSWRIRRETRWGLFFISPWLIGFLLFYLVPMVVSFLFSLHSFTLSAPGEAQFVGLDNWRRMLVNDPNTWASLKITFIFAIISLPTGMLSAFFLAVLLNSKYLLGRNIFRTLFYAPTMVPLIASILIWSSVLNPQSDRKSVV